MQTLPGTLTLPAQALKQTLHLVVNQDSVVRESVFMKFLSRGLKQEASLTKLIKLKTAGRTSESNLAELTKALASGKLKVAGDSVFVDVERILNQVHKTVRVLVTNLPYPEVAYPGQLVSDFYYGEGINAIFNSRMYTK